MKYLNDYPELPADAPIDHPHIIDTDLNEGVFKYELHNVPDTVVTILYKLRPEALTSFLNMDRPYFHYIHALENEDLFCIQRNSRQVTVRYSVLRPTNTSSLQF